MGLGVFWELGFPGCLNKLEGELVVDFGSFWVLPKSFPFSLSSGPSPSFSSGCSPVSPFLSSLAFILWVGSSEMWGALVAMLALPPVLLVGALVAAFHCRCSSHHSG